MQKAREPQSTVESPEGRKSGIQALAQDTEYTTSRIVNDIDDSATQFAEDVEKDTKFVAGKIEKDTKETATDIKNDINQDVLGINPSKSSRFDSAASGKDLTDNIKEPDKSEPPMPGKRNRYMDED